MRRTIIVDGKKVSLTREQALMLLDLVAEAKVVLFGGGQFRVAAVLCRLGFAKEGGQRWLIHSTPKGERAVNALARREARCA